MDQDGSFSPPTTDRIPVEQPTFNTEEHSPPKEISKDKVTEVEVEMNVKDKPPDGGYGWFVVLGSAFAHIILGGMDRADGVFFLKFVKKFNKSAQATAWIASLSLATRLMLGPLASMVSNRFSCRTAVIVGGLISAVAFFISGFTPHLEFLYFSFGLLGGLGMSLAYSPSLVIVGLYFNKRRGMAVGLATAGVGIGTFALPPLVEILFEHYDIFGAFLILTGICLNLCVCGALYQPLEKYYKTSRHTGWRKCEEYEIRPPEKETLLLDEESLQTKGETLSLRRVDHHKELSSDQLAESEQEKSVVTGDQNRRTKTAVVHSCPTLRRILKRCLGSNSDSVQSKGHTRLLEISLLKQPSFLLFCFSILLFQAAFKTVNTFYPALAKSRGCTEMQGAMLLSITGGVDTVARITTGIILDLPKIKPFRPWVYNTVMALIGVVSLMCPLGSTFMTFVFISCVFGLLAGMFVSQKSVIVVDILGAEKLTSSVGLLVFFQGIGSLVGPPLAGMIKDSFGQFDEAFYFGGGLILAAGILMALSNVFRVIHNKREKSPQQLNRGKFTVAKTNCFKS